MNPVILIPLNWKTESTQSQGANAVQPDDAAPCCVMAQELQAQLDALDQLNGVTRVIYLIDEVEPELRGAAEAQLKDICSKHPQCNPLVAGEAQLKLIQNHIEKRHPSYPGATIGFANRATVLNFGLCLAAILGHDIAIFLSQGVVPTQENFVFEAIYGIGRNTREGIPILVKSGYAKNQEGSPCKPLVYVGKENSLWNVNLYYNEWISRALSAQRITKSNILSEDCSVVHAQVFMKTAFDEHSVADPFFSYYLDVALSGYYIWFDTQCFVTEMGSSVQKERDSYPSPRQFYRQAMTWIYLSQKLELSRKRILPGHVNYHDLMPYPGKWLAPDLLQQLKRSALMRSVMTKEKAFYLSLYLKGLDTMERQAQASAYNHFALQGLWANLMAGLWKCPDLSVLPETAGPEKKS